MKWGGHKIRGRPYDGFFFTYQAEARVGIGLIFLQLRRQYA